MLDDLKNLNYQGGKDGLLFFISDVIGQNGIKIRDAEVICSHAPGKRYLSVKDLITYCLAFGWIDAGSDVVSVSPSFKAYVSDKEALNEKLILSTVEQLFMGGILDPSLFSYDAIHGCFSFKNELLPLSFSTVRNVLISQGFLITARDDQGTKFYIAPDYDSLVAKHCKTKRKQISLESLKKQLENNELAGERAELYVLSYEKERIGEPLCQSIKRISEIDTSAGYDIVSFNSLESQEPDRFIEVKAISNTGFFWSRNEYEIAKLKGDMYYLYLVELSRVNEPGYEPKMIRDPAVNVMGSDSWFVEAESFHIKQV